LGLDIDKLKKKLAETKEKTTRGGGGGDFKFWSPSDGRNVVRFLPPKEGKEDFYSETMIHYNLGPKQNKQAVCRKAAGEKSCPACDFVDELFKGDKDDEKLAKKIKAKMKYYYNVVDRSLEEDDEGYGEVLVYGGGVSVFEEILGIICDPDYGDVTDSEKGFDIIINKSGKGLDTEYKVNARPKQSEIGIEDWETKLVDLDVLTNAKSEEDIIHLMEEGEWPARSSDDDDEEEEDKKKKKKKDKKKKKKKPEPEPEPEEEEEDEDEDEEEDVDEDEEEDEDDDEDEDEDDDDEEEDDDDIEAEIAKVLKKKKKK
jgi:hypothetical protein